MRKLLGAHLLIPDKFLGTVPRNFFRRFPVAIKLNRVDSIGQHIRKNWRPMRGIFWVEIRSDYDYQNAVKTSRNSSSSNKSKFWTDDERRSRFGIFCRAVARVLKGGFDQIFFVGALLDPSQIQLGGLGERCKLPQRGLGRSPRRSRIWCILD